MNYTQMESKVREVLDLGGFSSRRAGRSTAA
jgi:hypothetical protein